ncbi:GAF domain-containing protein [Actinokineospora sp. 24-640]
MSDTEFRDRELPHAEPGRLAAVRRYEIRDAPGDGAVQRVAEMAAALFAAPIGSVSIVDEDRVWFAGSAGLDGVCEVGVEPGFCASVILRDEPYVVTDATTDPRTAGHPLVRGEWGVRFYAAAPITSPDGHRLGTVNVMDTEPREASPDQAGMLTILAGIVAEHLELRLAALLALRAEQGLPAETDGKAAHSATLAAQLRHAALRHAETPHPTTCQLGVTQPCFAAAELKVADSWGDCAWGCLPHVEEVIVCVPSVFIADRERADLAHYLTR